MNRKSPRRFASHIKQNEEQQFNEQPTQQSSNNYEQGKDNDNVIADMAQGFIQAQAKMSEKTNPVSNLEIALLLQKCNSQLEEIRRSTQTNSTSGGGGQQNNGGISTQDNKKQQVPEMTSQDLQSLLATVLQGNSGNSGNNGSSDSNSSTTKANSEGNAGKSPVLQNTEDNKSTTPGEKQNMMTVQTVSQVLAQAQYELANELENSLKKLKQVITESEQIANNISNLLGEEGTKKT